MSFPEQNSSTSSISSISSLSDYSSSNSDEPNEAEITYRNWQAAYQQLQADIQQAAEAESSRTRRRRSHIKRGREEGHARLFNDYFSEEPTYSDAQFRRRFRMRRPIFQRIVDRLSNAMPYFQQRPDATGRQGLSPLQKCTAALRQLANGVAADACDEYIRIGAETARNCLHHFVDGVINLFGDEYLRRPTPTNLQRLLRIGEARGFPGMLGSIDCMHWRWKNCPAAWAGQFHRGDHEGPTIILEVVASYDMWIWHAFFGTPGTCNDINVLHRSPVFDDVLQGVAPPVNFTINGHEYRMGYYLTDGIYPDWATFVKSISLPRSSKAKLFARLQEGYRKDVERAFGALRARFAIVRNPTLALQPELLGKIMKTCIILHNIVVEDERIEFETIGYVPPVDFGQDEVDQTFSRERPSEMSAYIRNYTELQNRVTNRRLKEDLVEHVWRTKGHEYDDV